MYKKLFSESAKTICFSSAIAYFDLDSDPASFSDRVSLVNMC